MMPQTHCVIPQTHWLPRVHSFVNLTVGFSPSTSLISKTYLFTPPAASRETQMIVGPIAEGWKLNRPLMLVVEVDDDGTYLVSDKEFAVYGEGVNRKEAARDYVASLIEYFQLLESHAKRHAPTAVLFGRLGAVLSRSRRDKTGDAKMAI